MFPANEAFLADRLPGFLRHAAGRRFVTWEFDCTYWLASWYMAATGRPDPIPEYRDPHAAASAIGPLGFARLVARVARRAGLRPTSEPSYGDIGLLRNGKGLEVYGAIKARAGWFLFTPSGLGHIPDRAACVRVVAAWALPRG